MKKLINLKLNEIVDIESEEETPVFKISQYEMIYVTKEIKYKLTKPRPSHWGNKDGYKVVEA